MNSNEIGTEKIQVFEIPQVTPTGILNEAIYAWKEKRHRDAAFRITSETTGVVSYLNNNEEPTDFAFISREGRFRRINGFAVLNRRLVYSSKLHGLGLPINRSHYPMLSQETCAERIRYISGRASDQNCYILPFNNLEFSEITIERIINRPANYLNFYGKKEKVMEAVAEAKKYGVGYLVSTHYSLSGEAYYKYDLINNQQLELFPEILV